MAPSKHEAGPIAGGRLTLRIDFDSKRRLGPGKVRLLELVGSLGSISAAGRDMKMSYKRAWTLAEELNRTFAQPVIAASAGGPGGGRAELTATGHAIVRAYRDMESRAAAASVEARQILTGLVAPEG